jgi:hypothetical protein
MAKLMIFFLAMMIVLSGGQTRAQESEEVEDVEFLEDVSKVSNYQSKNFPRIDRALNLLTATSARKGHFLFIVDHRNREAMDEDPAHNLLGFDSGGLKIGLGIRYGLLDNLDIGLYRVNGTSESFDTYDMDFRYRFLNQKDHFVDLAIRPGITVFTQEGEDDALEYFGQLLVSRTFFDRLLVGTGLLYHSDSSNELKTNKDDDESFAVQGLMEFRILPNFALDLEMCAKVDGYGSDHPQLRAGFKYFTHRHTFAIVVSNTQYMSASGGVSNTDHDLGDAVLGFTITRELAW